MSPEWTKPLKELFSAMILKLTMVEAAGIEPASASDSRLGDYMLSHWFILGPSAFSDKLRRPGPAAYLSVRPCVRQPKPRRLKWRFRETVTVSPFNVAILKN